MEVSCRTRQSRSKSLIKKKSNLLDLRVPGEKLRWGRESTKRPWLPRKLLRLHALYAIHSEPFITPYLLLLLLTLLPLSVPALLEACLEEGHLQQRAGQQLEDVNPHQPILFDTMAPVMADFVFPLPLLAFRLCGAIAVTLHLRHFIDHRIFLVVILGLFYAPVLPSACKVGLLGFPSRITAHSPARRLLLCPSNFVDSVAQIHKRRRGHQNDLEDPEADVGERRKGVVADVLTAGLARVTHKLTLLIVLLSVGMERPACLAEEERLSDEDKLAELRLRDRQGGVCVRLVVRAVHNVLTADPRDNLCLQLITLGFLHLQQQLVHWEVLPGVGGVVGAQGLSGAHVIGPVSDIKHPGEWGTATLLLSDRKILPEDCLLTHDKSTGGIKLAWVSENLPEQVTHPSVLQPRFNKIGVGIRDHHKLKVLLVVLQELEEVEKASSGGDLLYR
ncbi:unnamed protein product [Menidia menidia]|uniref:(Atlantic silverside) hypothetical protein n=1 Tax=Menidia menidia TaxID=238744 RepID=A0A8S4B0A4_9TELE|nr:unnamed protein product [Menidia menidia]